MSACPVARPVVWPGRTRHTCSRPLSAQSVAPTDVRISMHTPRRLAAGRAPLSTQQMSGRGWLSGRVAEEGGRPSEPHSSMAAHQSRRGRP